MGLDITAYSKLKKVEVELNEDGYPVDEDVYGKFARVCVTGGRGQHDDLVDRAFYEYESDFGFRAGSYTGYSQWRETLAKLAGYPEVEFDHRFLGLTKSHSPSCWDGTTQGPFAELIDFSDCEGTIGPITAAKLARDFAEFEERARNFTDGVDGYFFMKYMDWKQAFELAADGGMVDFH